VGTAYAKSAVLTIYGGTGEIKGRSQIALSAQRYFDAFQNTAFSIGRIWQKGSTWAVEWTFSGTQSGDFMGVAAKSPGAAVGVTGISVVSFDEKGLISKEHRYVDGMTMHDQMLGRSPVRAAPQMAAAAETHASKGGAEEQKMIDATKALYVAIDAHKSDDYLPVISDGATYDDFTTSSTLSGKAQIKSYLATIAKTIPDAAHAEPLIFAADDFVVCEWLVNGTHAATSKPVELHGVDVLEWKDGSLVTAASFSNARELLVEIGKLPTP
jgi:predicted ester cyclase